MAKDTGLIISLPDIGSAQEMPFEALNNNALNIASTEAQDESSFQGACGAI